MAFSLGTSSGGIRRGRFRGTTSLAEINIIPLVDVVLVLLIIFMLTAHVMEFGLEVDVPTVRITRETPDVLPVVTVTRKGELLLNAKPMKLRELTEQIQVQFKGAKKGYVQGDGAAHWESVGRG